MATHAKHARRWPCEVSPRWRGLPWLALLCLLGAAAAPAQAKDDGAGGACHVVTKQSAYRGLGYRHIVTIQNTCDDTIKCSVTTSSNPEPAEVEVPAKSKQSVLMHANSPAREFEAYVKCTGGKPRAPRHRT